MEILYHHSISDTNTTKGRHSLLRSILKDTQRAQSIVFELSKATNCAIQCTNRPGSEPLRLPSKSMKGSRWYTPSSYSNWHDSSNATTDIDKLRQSSRSNVGWRNTDTPSRKFYWRHPFSSPHLIVSFCFCFSFMSNRWVWTTSRSF